MLIIKVVIVVQKQTVKEIIVQRLSNAQLNIVPLIISSSSSVGKNRLDADPSSTILRIGRAAPRSR